MTHQSQARRHGPTPSPTRTRPKAEAAAGAAPATVAACREHVERAVRRPTRRRHPLQRRGGPRRTRADRGEDLRDHRTSPTPSWPPSWGRGRVGMIFYARSPRRCSLEEAAVIAAALRRRVELCGVFVNAPLEDDRARQRGARADAAAAARRRGPVVLRGGRAPDGRARDQGRAGRGPGDVRDLERFHVDFHLLDARASAQARAGMRGGTGETFDWGSRRGAPLDGPADPERRPATPATWRGDRESTHAVTRVDTRQRHRVGARPQGSASGCGALRRGRGGPIAASPRQLRAGRRERGRRREHAAVEHRFGPYGGQFVPETLMPALAELEQAWLQARDGPRLPRAS